VGDVSSDIAPKSVHFSHDVVCGSVVERGVVERVSGVQRQSSNNKCHTSRDSYLATKSGDDDNGGWVNSSVGLVAGSGPKWPLYHW
jgi:hypothetical protein